MSEHQISEADWNRFQQYVTGQGTPDEIETLRRWVAADPELKALSETLQTASWPSAAGAAPRTRDAQAAWQRLHRRMRWAGEPAVVEQGRRRHRIRWALAMAATIAVVVAIPFGMARWGWLTVDGDGPAVSSSPMRDVVTRRGERAALDLPDGSRVVLAAESRLRIPATYRASHGARDVALDGEAYFEVRHDERRPFRVRAGNGIVEDLGTEFVVTAYPETHGVQVVVATGAAALHAAQAGAERGRARPLLTLAPGDLARLDSSGTATLTPHVNLAPYLSWVEGTLVFDGSRLRDVLPRLSRWYDLDIRLTDSVIGDRRLTTSVGNKPADQVLEAIALSLDLNVRRSGRRVLLSPAKSAPRAP